MRRAVSFLVFVVMLATASTAAYARLAEVTGVETAVFADREVVVLRHIGGVTVSPRYFIDNNDACLTIALGNVRLSEPKYVVAKQPLLASMKSSSRRAPAPGTTGRFPAQAPRVP